MEGEIFHRVMDFQVKSGRIVLEECISSGFETGFILACLCQVTAVETDESKADQFSTGSC